MKLKQLVFNSLPRPKSKQKKKLQEQETKKAKEQQQKVSSQKDGRSRSSCLYKSSLSQYRIPEEGRTSPAHRDVNQNQPPMTAGTPSPPGAKVDKPKLDLAEVKPKRAISRHFNVNLNLNTGGGDAKCACYKHLRPLDSPDDFPPPPQESRYYNLSSSSMEDSGFSSLPKTRTRIKTNPWVPSPRSTPSTSPDLSPMASSSSSPIYSDRRSFDSNDSCQQPVSLDSCQPVSLDSSDSSCHPPVSIDSSDSSHPPASLSSDDRYKPAVSNDRKTFDKKPRRRDNIYEEINTLNMQAQNCLSQTFCDTFSVRSTDSDSLLQRSLLSDTDNTGTDILVTTDNNSASSDKAANMCQINPAGAMDNTQPPPSTNPEDQLYVNQDFDPHVSFDYEEAFESQLEANGVGRCLGSRDDLSDGSGDDDLFNDPLGSRAHDFDSEYCPSNYDSSCNEYTSETETDDTVCDDYYTETGLRRGGRPAPFNDIFRDYYHYADDEEEKDMSEDNFSLGSHTNLYQTTHDLTNQSYNEGQTQGRTLGQVRLSLQDKVNRLRRDKFIVDEKIREAQEEERLRVQEKMRFQKQMTLARKQLLLQTLQNLKVKLEGQSERLQQTYTAVLSMQRAVITNRKQNLQSRPQPAIPNTREAPF